MNLSGHPIRVLIADDHPLMRDGLRFMLQPESGIEVVAEAADGADCLKKFREHRPDVALIDLQMPKVDGLRVIGTLRGEYADARFVVLTSFAGDARVTRADLAEVGALIKWPVHLRLHNVCSAPPRSGHSRARR